jgi:5-oxoprolinase (ATP-hydrolysing) subunit A
MDIPPKEVYEITLYQIGAIDAFVRITGEKLQHVKPHGALYNMASKNKEMAAAIAEAVYAFDPGLFLFGLSGSELISAAKAVGLKTANEAFVDRTYQSDGSLTLRKENHALIIDSKIAAQQALKIISEQKVNTQQGKEISILADTLCIHGDNPFALKFVKEIKSILVAAGVTVKSLGK